MPNIKLNSFYFIIIYITLNNKTVRNTDYNVILKNYVNRFCSGCGLNANFCISVVY